MPIYNIYKDIPIMTEFPEDWLPFEPPFPNVAYDKFEHPFIIAKSDVPLKYVYCKAEFYQLQNYCLKVAQHISDTLHVPSPIILQPDIFTLKHNLFNSLSSSLQSEFLSNLPSFGAQSLSIPFVLAYKDLPIGFSSPNLFIIDNITDFILPFLASANYEAIDLIISFILSQDFSPYEKSYYLSKSISLIYKYDKSNLQFLSLKISTLASNLADWYQESISAKYKSKNLLNDFVRFVSILKQNNDYLTAYKICNSFYLKTYDEAWLKRASSLNKYIK